MRFKVFLIEILHNSAPQPQSQSEFTVLNELWFLRNRHDQQRGRNSTHTQTHSFSDLNVYVEHAPKIGCQFP